VEGARGKSRIAELIKKRSRKERERLFCQVIDPSGTMRKRLWLSIHSLRTGAQGEKAWGGIDQKREWVLKSLAMRVGMEGVNGRRRSGSRVCEEEGT
jgi:hypothetical protein